jgi:hypothetical protein
MFKVFNLIMSKKKKSLILSFYYNKKFRELVGLRKLIKIKTNPKTQKSVDKNT